MAYMSESEKVRELPEVMKYITGDVIDIGCAGSKITPSAFGVDGREFKDVDLVTDNVYNLWEQIGRKFDTVFSSHLLEHLPDQYNTIIGWSYILNSGGHLVLCLPCGTKYNNRENPEHMIDMKYDDFMFWFTRCFCGEGKNFRGENLPKLFELVHHQSDYGNDRYSFIIIAKKI